MSDNQEMMDCGHYDDVYDVDDGVAAMDLYSDKPVDIVCSHTDTSCLIISLLLFSCH